MQRHLGDDLLPTCTRPSAVMVGIRDTYVKEATKVLLSR